MQSAAQAYGKVARQIATPRELEANLLLRAAAHLQAVCSEWTERQVELREALLFNRKLWTILMTSVTSEDNPLSVEIRQNVANLGLFVLNHTVEVMNDPRPEQLDSLIKINRDVAAGLMGRAA